jgi:hypothetical protein
MSLNDPTPPEPPKEFKTLQQIWRDFENLQRRKQETHIPTAYWLAERNGAPYIFKDTPDGPEYRVMFMFAKSESNQFIAAKYTEHDGALTRDSYLEYSFADLGRLVDRTGAGFVPVPLPAQSQTDTAQELPAAIEPQQPTPLQQSPAETEETTAAAGHVRAATNDLLQKIPEQGRRSAQRVWEQIKVLRQSPDFRLNWQGVFNEYDIPQRLRDMREGESEDKTKLGIRLCQQTQMRIGYKPKDLDDAKANAIPTLIIRIVRKWKELESGQTEWRFSAPQVRAFAAFVAALEDLWENRSDFLRELHRKKIGQVVIDSGGLISQSGEKLKELLTMAIAFGMVPEDKE